MIGRARPRVGLVAVTGWEGGRAYAENLARGLLRLPPDERPELHWFALAGTRVHPEVAAGARVHQAPRVTAAEGLLRPAAAVARRAWLAAAIARHRLDFVYPVTPPLPTRARTGAWIPDFQHHHMPEMFGADEIRARDHHYGRAARWASVVVLSSASAARDFAAFAPDCVGKARVLRFATPLAERDLPDVEAPGPSLGRLPPRFAYCANQFWRHKDHPTLLRAIARLAAEGVRVPLVCTGALDDYRHPGWMDHVRRIIADAKLDEQVTLLGLLPRGEQLAVMRRAAVVVQPSLFEGWSTVVEDARALGLRVVASDLPVHLEQAPPRATYFARGSDEALAARLREAWAEPDAPPPPPALVRRRSEERAVEVARTLLRIAAGTEPPP